MDNVSPKHWFALYTRPRHEFKACQNIAQLDIENYLPVITKKKKWSDRIKSISEPLLRGYVFIFASEKERLDALTVDSVVNTVCFNGVPAVIPAWQIESLKKMLEHADQITFSEKIQPGSVVKVVAGPMEGIVGVVEESMNNERYISLSIEIINRTVSLKLPAESVVKLLE